MIGRGGLPVPTAQEEVGGLPVPTAQEVWPAGD